MDPYVLGDGVLVMTPFCSVLQCLCARPLASALMRFRSAKRGVVMPTTLSRLAACVACLPATPCLSLRALHIARSVRPAGCRRSSEQEGESQKRGKRSSRTLPPGSWCACSQGCKHSMRMRCPCHSHHTRAACVAAGRSSRKSSSTSSSCRLRPATR